MFPFVSLICLLLDFKDNFVKPRQFISVQHLGMHGKVGKWMLSKKLINESSWVPKDSFEGMSC